MRRLLITGSRHWSDVAQIKLALQEAFAELCGPSELGSGLDRVMLVSGNCPTGADAICELVWAVNVSKELIELHPADWKTHGKKAGFVRNSEMVSLGADLCLAFIQDASRGATMTANLAEKAGIPTKRFILDTLPPF